MKNIKYVLIFILTFMFFNSCFNNLKAIDYPLDIDVVLIQFNFDLNSYSEDAYSIVPGYNSLVIHNEWINDGGISKNDKIAYIKSQTNRKIKVKFWHNQNQSVSYNFIIGNAVSEGTSFGYAPYTSVYFPSNNNGYSEVKTYQLNGTVPSSVGKRYVKFAWQCTNYALSLGYTGKHYYYTLLAAPQAPMGTPWTSVLDYACVWASGTGSSGYYGSVAAKIVQGLYNWGLLYDINNGEPNFTDDGGNSDFELTNFLAANGTNSSCNCFDMGKAVKTFCNAVGCGLEYGYSYPFGYLNCIKPIGRDWTNDPFDTQGIVAEDSYRSKFNNHAFALKYSNIYDSCIKVDTDSNPDYGPPHTESWLTGVYWTTYKSRVVDDNPFASTGSPSYSYNSWDVE